MADGDFTLAAVNTDSKPALLSKAFKLVVSADYKVGGYAITPTNVGLTTIVGVQVVSGGAGYYWAWNGTALIGYEQADSDNDLAFEAIVDSQAIGTPTLYLIVWGYKS